MDCLFAVIVSLAMAVDEPSAAAVDKQSPSTDFPSQQSTLVNGPPTVEQKWVPSFPADFVSLFTECSLQYTGGGYVRREFRYRMFIPDPLPGEKKQPLVVWLHGFREGGEHNLAPLRYLDKLIFTPPRDRTRFPFFFLAVQCPEDNGLWTSDSSHQDDMINVVDAIIDELLKEHSIDPDRVSLAGISSGGNGCWELAMRRPDRFSAASPISSSKCDPQRIGNLENLPVWIFQSKRDSTKLVKFGAEALQTVSDAGGVAKLTEVNSDQASRLDRHDAWTDAIRNHGLLMWLINQRRGQAKLISRWNWLRHEYLNFDFILPRSLPVVAILICLIVWKVEQRKRIKAAQAKTTQDVQASPITV